MVTDHRRLQVLDWFLSHPGQAVLSIVLVACVAYGLFYVPALYGDDWSQDIEPIIRGHAQWLNLNQLRPLLYAPFLLQYHVFGFAPGFQYCVIWAAYLFMAFLVYVIVKSVMPGGLHTHALVIALLFLVYPTNFAHMWLTMVHPYSALMLTLLYAFFSLKYARHEHPAYLALAFICLSISLGLYEGQLGISAAWPLILFFVFRHRTALGRRILCFAPIVVAGGLSVWRVWGYRSPYDYYNLSLVSLDPHMLASRFILGYKISLGWGWTNTIEELIPRIGGAWHAAFFLGALTVSALVLAEWLVRASRSKGQARYEGACSLRQRWAACRSTAIGGCIGLGLIGAGYVPIAAVVLPNLTGVESRVNLFATLGASVCLASVLMLGALLVCRSRASVHRVFLAGALPFVLLGIVTHASVQYRTRIAWLEQRAIWHELFRIAPNFKDETMVLFVLSGFEDRQGYRSWWRMPLWAYWDASAALRLLYGNASLQADVVFPGIERFNEPILSAEGIRNWRTGDMTPYSRTVAFVYERGRKGITRLDRLPSEFVDGAAEPIRTCPDCVLKEPAANVPLRTLVQEK
jgi:hypothetical protein